MQNKIIFGKIAGREMHSVVLAGWVWGDMWVGGELAVVWVVWCLATTR